MGICRKAHTEQTPSKATTYSTLQYPTLGLQSVSVPWQHTTVYRLKRTEGREQGRLITNKKALGITDQKPETLSPTP